MPLISCVPEFPPGGLLDALQIRVVTVVEFAQHACAKQSWRKIDVTGKSVEEVSREIILLASSEAGSEHGEPRK